MMDTCSGKVALNEEVPVLIVGGSLVGLSAALFLAWRGVPCLLVERHPGLSPHPRAAGFHGRTLEIFRAVGVEPAIRRVEPPSYQNSGILRVETLAGKELGWLTPNFSEAQPGPEISPTRGSIIPQVLLEPILRARAEELGAALRYHTEQVSFTLEADGIRAVILDRETGAERTVRARYLIAADGNRSSIRQHLGIAMHGPGVLANQISILFRADLRPALRDRRIFLCFVNNPEVQGALGFAPDGQSGGLVAAYDPDKGEREEDFAGERGVALVRAAVGIPDLPVEILSALSWKLAAQTAERFQEGRVFLAGDAAHVMPPAGAFGANTGIVDAYNLAWKLALVVQGKADPALLSTYAAERRPVAQATVDQAFNRYVERLAPHLAAQAVAPHLDHLTVVFGARYRSAAVLSEDGPLDDVPFVDPFHSAGLPGTRAPHLALARAGEPLSTLDLFGQNFVLLAGPSGAAWQGAARRVAESRGLALDAYRIGGDGELKDPHGGFPDAYGITSSGAVLVRPDGIVGWRAKRLEAAPEAALVQALTQILGR